jgi:hypothetical protein
MSVISRRCSPVLALALGAALLVACGDEAKPSQANSLPTAGGASIAAGNVGSSGTGQPSTLFVANTGGTGVALRSRCEDAARSGGTGFRDGTEGHVVTSGSEQCAGWTLIDAGGTTSWVRNEYLTTERPAGLAAPGGVAAVPSRASQPVAPSSGGGAPPPPQTLNVRGEKVLEYGGHLIPVSQLTYRSADFGPILLTATGPKPGAYICPVYNYSAPAVVTLGGVTLQDPDPAGCGFARADTAVIRDVVIPQ